MGLKKARLCMEISPEVKTQKPFMTQEGEETSSL